MLYIKNCIFNTKVVWYAAKRLVGNAAIVYFIIIIPSFFALPGDSVTEKIKYLIVITVVLFLFLLLVSFILKWIQVLLMENAEDFYKLTEKERGGAIGDLFN